MSLIFPQPHRRDFLKSLPQIATAWGLSTSSWGLSTAGQIFANSSPVSFDLETSILMSAIQHTSRPHCVETTIELIRKGVTPTEFLRALFLCGIRDINPHPPGFKLHAVLSMTSVHQLVEDLPDESRWLPLIWAFDNYKGAADQDLGEGDFVLREFEGEIPSPAIAQEKFHQAMANWDHPQAEGALISLIRSRGANEVIEQLWLYGARDYRNIGHKAIVVSNAWKTLQIIGWEYAEPVLRSSLASLLDFGPAEIVNQFAFEDQCFLSNISAAESEISQLPDDWAVPTGFSSDATSRVLESLRSRPLAEVRLEILTLLKNREIHANSIWDAIHLAAGEMMIRKPDIYPLHAVTSGHALHYAYRQSSVTLTRLSLLLQGAGWVVQFRDFIESQPGLPPKIDLLQIQKLPIPQSADQVVNNIFHSLPKDIPEATRLAFSYGKQFLTDETFCLMARQLVALKGVDPHDYKYASVMFDLLQWVHP